MSTKSIDWSKAPEGATHFEAARDESECDVFWRVKDGVALQVWRLIPWKKDPSEQVETFTYSLKGCDDFDASRAVPRPVSWSGEGLPPVGTACEWLDPGSDRWLPVEIVFLSSWVIVVRDTNPHPDGSVDLAFDLINDNPQFRAVRTPEQIAAEKREAEKREKAAKQICIDAGSPDQTAGQMAIAYRLYDAGYRKVDPAGAQP